LSFIYFTSGQMKKHSESIWKKYMPLKNHCTRNPLSWYLHAKVNLSRGGANHWRWPLSNSEIFFWVKLSWASRIWMSCFWPTEFERVAFENNQANQMIFIVFNGQRPLVPISCYNSLFDRPCRDLLNGASFLFFWRKKVDCPRLKRFCMVSRIDARAGRQNMNRNHNDAKPAGSLFIFLQITCDDETKKNWLAGNSLMHVFYNCNIV